MICVQLHQIKARFTRAPKAEISSTFVLFMQHLHKSLDIFCGILCSHFTQFHNLREIIINYSSKRNFMLII